MTDEAKLAKNGLPRVLWSGSAQAAKPGARKFRLVLVEDGAADEGERALVAPDTVVVLEMQSPGADALGAERWHRVRSADDSETAPELADAVWAIAKALHGASGPICLGCYDDGKNAKGEPCPKCERGAQVAAGSASR